MEAFYGIITVGGGLLLLLVIAFAVIKNRQRSRSERELTERATRAQYESDGPDIKPRR